MKFVCGLLPDPRLLMDHVYTSLNEHIMRTMRNLFSQLYIDTSLLESLYQESAVPLLDSVLHNQHINYYDRFRPRDTTPVFTPSKLYMFECMMEDVTLRHRTTEIGAIRCRDARQSERNSSNNQKCANWIL